MDKLIKLLNENGIYHEINTTCGGNKLVFVEVENSNKTLKLIKKHKVKILKWSYCGDFNWINIVLD